METRTKPSRTCQLVPLTCGHREGEDEGQEGNGRGGVASGAGEGFGLVGGNSKGEGRDGVGKGGLVIFFFKERERTLLTKLCI